MFYFLYKGSTSVSHFRFTISKLYIWTQAKSITMPWSTSGMESASRVISPNSISPDLNSPKRYSCSSPTRDPSRNVDSFWFGK